MLNPIHSPSLAARFLDRFHPAELPQGRVTRLLRVHPRVEVLLRLHLDMRTHLRVHIRVELALLEQSADSKLKFSPPGHDSRLSQLSVVSGQSRFTHHASRITFHTSASRGFQDQIDGRGKAFPIGGLFDELLATGRSQLVELRLAVVLRSHPFRTDPSLLLQTIERRV